MEPYAVVKAFMNFLVFPVYVLALLGVSFLLVHVWGKKLPRDAAMGLVMSLFLPAFGHLYVYKARSLGYVAGLLVVGWALLGVAGWWVTTLTVTALSFWLMYRRLVVNGEDTPPENPDLYTLAVQVDAATLARFNDYLDASGLDPNTAAARAISALPLELEEESGFEACSAWPRGGIGNAAR